MGDASFRETAPVGMKSLVRPPRVVAVEPLEYRVLRVSFENGVVKLYDVKPLLSLPMFKPLEDEDVFREVVIEPGGYAVSWGTIADISEHELWEAGIAHAPTARNVKGRGEAELAN